MLQGKIASINAEVAKLSGTGVERILDAINEQRFFFIKNKTKVILDTHTGLLWANLKYFPYGSNNNTSCYSNSSDTITGIIESYNFDGFFRFQSAFKF